MILKRAYGLLLNTSSNISVWIWSYNRLPGSFKMNVQEKPGDHYHGDANWNTR